MKIAKIVFIDVLVLLALDKLLLVRFWSRPIWQKRAGT